MKYVLLGIVGLIPIALGILALSDVKRTSQFLERNYIAFYGGKAARSMSRPVFVYVVAGIFIAIGLSFIWVPTHTLLF
jgi:hypothetical protein